jgi:signal transduction histidine kinase
MVEGRRASRLAGGLAGSIVVLLLAAVVFLVLSFDTPPPEEAFGFRGWGLFLAISFGGAGYLVASRVPANPIGWLLLAAGIGIAAQEFAAQYTNYGAYDSPGAVPGVRFTGWIPEWIWIPSMAIVTVFVPLIYPNGRLLSPRWRPVVVLASIAVALATLSFALVPGRLESSPGLRNPVGLPGALWLRPVGNLSMAFFVAVFVSAIGSIVVRYRRSGSVERQQLKWLGLALAGLLLAFAAGAPYWMLTGLGATTFDLLENLVVAGLCAIPVAIGVAILRHRLLDIDVVIKKTVVYAVLAILLFLVGVVPAWALGGVVVDATGSGEYSWLLAGLLIGVAIWPLRRLATRIADRLVYGRRATPYEVLSEFSGRVAETYAADDVLQRMAQVLGEAVDADAATVWLGPRDRARPVATWPAEARPDDRPPAEAVAVRHQGIELGSLSVRMPANDPMNPTRERLIHDLAGQAGLVLRNATLFEDLKASRQRLVSAQDAERRRLERNIHDGAQQQLVALAVKLKLADALVGRDEARAHDLLAQLHEETNRALENLRDLARGIYPPLLADKGLGAALESQARKSATPVSVESDGIGRYPQEAEAAVYFSALEALQNVAKYAEASRATVRLAQVDGHLTFEVVDDGVGFDPDAVARGMGLQGIADRLAALGGEVTITSAPGDGTTVAGRLPVEATR